MEARNHMPKPEPNLICGHFSRREAAEYIAHGKRHIHSSPLGSKDICARSTKKANERGEVPTYPWEKTSEAKSIQLHSSAERHKLIQRILIEGGLSTKRDLSEKVVAVLEELLTNAIYHSYRDPDGNRKYPRLKAAMLSESETVTVRFSTDSQGIYLSVTDQGGALGFEDIARCFERCYGKREDQIEAKESGAGLGMYMVFETATHLKVESQKGNCTTVSCWLGDKKSFDPRFFSFNFFDRR